MSPHYRTGAPQRRGRLALRSRGIGNTYRKTNGYYGGYQGNFLKRGAALHPDRGWALHVFSSMVDTTFPGDTLDIRPDLNPTYCRDAETTGRQYATVIGLFGEQ
ncbi:MAG: hypothetical protein FWD12_14085 [Alphaproteobacteria bacterium]|nr:hypothetical protein [Alphaproteobacteria bacterium]